MSDQVLLALISSLGTVIVGYIGRWFLFRLTLNGKFAIGADEEFKAFRQELQVKIRELEGKIETLVNQNNTLLVERMARDIKIIDLQEELASAKGRITELEAHVVSRDEKIHRLEERIDGLKNRSGETKEG
jgi:chromosome segregation ATPase